MIINYLYSTFIQYLIISAILTYYINIIHIKVNMFKG